MPLMTAGLWVLVAGAALLAGQAGAKDGKTLRFIPQADLRVLDPVWTSAYITRNHAYMIYDTLFGMDEQLKPQPQMVDHWSLSPDKLTYSFTLREGLKFHDGQPVRAQDCVATLQRWMKRDSLGQKLADALGEMTAVDERSFTIVLKHPFPLLIESFAKLSQNPFIMPERVAKTDANAQIKDTTGSGPFIFDAKGWNPGDKAVYVRNPDYVPRPEAPHWTAGGKIAKVDRVEWVYIPDATTAANALLAGEVDWWQQVPTDLIPLLKKNKEIHIAASDPLGYQAVLRFNHLQPPFNNVKLRQAVLAALDQKEYMQAVAGDPEYWRTCYSFYACGTPMTSETGAEPLKGKRDLAQVRALVKEAGYHGEKIIVLDATDYAAVHAEALVTADLLKRLGLNAELATSDWGTLLTRRSKRGPVEEGGWSIFHTSYQGPDSTPMLNDGLRANGEQAWFGWPSDPKIEALRDQFVVTEDHAAQQMIAAEIQEEGFKIVPYIPLGQFAIPTAWRDRLSGIILSPVVEIWNVEKR
jgi:peptide/nickel transport system substrate-binding protein